MTKIQAAYRRGGLAEVIPICRKRLAATIYPGTMPQPQKQPSRTTPPVVPVPVPTVAPEKADSVTYEKAIAFFEPRKPGYVTLSEAVRPYVQREGTILDVGANIGYFTKVLAETLDFHGTAHLFEPIPHLAELARKTAATFDFDARVHEFGLSDEAAEVEIFIAASGNLGWNTMISERRTTDMTAVNIVVKPYRDAGIDAVPCFVKIDVEGAEYKVLGGMLDAIEGWQPRPPILCEIGWGAQGHPEWGRELEVFDRLRSLGYHAVDLSHDPVVLEDLAKTTDIIFVPNN